MSDFVSHKFKNQQSYLLLPTTRQELSQLGWDQLDIILVSGDAYIDSPFMGVSMIGRLLAKSGYRVGIIGQPDWQSTDDIARLGEPRLFWGVSGGAVDSMVANYTASGRKRRTDDYTPGGKNERRPDRAVIVYSNLIRQRFKETTPLVLGGIEASLRRIAHYDFWNNKVRNPILFDAKADYLVYGMGEKATLELAQALQNGEDPSGINGLCYIGNAVPPEYKLLPSVDQSRQSKQNFIKMFDLFYRNCDPIHAQGLAQQVDSRYLIQNPPAPTLSETEMDQLYALGFTRDVHPYYASQGEIKATETITFSQSTHRGCYGECNFCAIAVHEGRTIQSRSEQSILKETDQLVKRADFKGYIHDVGGPTANMFGFECEKKLKHGACPAKRCIFPKVCGDLRPNHSRQISLLKKIRRQSGIKKVFVASGLRYDLLPADEKYGQQYLEQLVRHHVSGQLRVAPEHTDPRLLELMGKPPIEALTDFKQMFDKLSRSAGKKQYLSYYFIAAHPGCTQPKMQKLKAFVSGKLNLSPEQVQIFTPTPSTWSSVMYYTGLNPFAGSKLFVERSVAGRTRQKEILTDKLSNTGHNAVALTVRRKRFPALKAGKTRLATGKKNVKKGDQTNLARQSSVHKVIVF